MASSGSLNLNGYKLTFDDEFNSFSSNGPSNYQIQGGTGTWDTTYSYGERKLNDEVQMYSDSTVGVNPFSVSGGVLDIHAAPSVDPSKTMGQNYTSGAITTFHSFSQQYGYFEMRAQLPAASGMWPAFWMLSQEHVWPPEIDALEAFGAVSPGGDGGAYSFHNGAVVTGSGGQGDWRDTNGANLYTQYNTFGVDWQADKITFYFNGQAAGSMATPSDFHRPMYLLANLAVGGNWAGAPRGETADMKIDYIRGFSKDGANPAIAQQSASSPDGRGFSFYGATDANGNGGLGGADAAAPAPTSAAPVPPAPKGDQTVGAGLDDLTIVISEDYYQGDAQFVVTVDGKQIGGTLSTSAIHWNGERQAFHIKGNFGAGQHTAGVNFLNNAGGGPDGDRNLYVDGASINGVAIPGVSIAEYIGGERTFSFAGTAPAPIPTTAAPAPSTPKAGGPASTPAPSASGSDTVVVKVSEDAYQGDAQFTIAVNGNAVGGVRTATASHGAGKTEAVTLNGNFGASPTITVSFLNDKWDGTAATDRNLYVDGVTYNGLATKEASASLLSNGSADFHARAAASVPDTVVVKVSEDAYQGDAQFTIAVNGNTIGGVRTASASHAAGRSEDITLKGSFGPGSTITVSFLNDKWDGTAATDRNLYVDGVTYNGWATQEASASLLSNGSTDFHARAATSAAGNVVLQLSEDAYQGDAKFSIAVDGKAIGQTGVVTALRAAGQSQAVTIPSILAAGAHDIAVTFLNDAYGGSADTDRNLFVTGATVNGVQAAGVSADMYGAFTQHLNIVVPNP